ncbi:MAG: L-idonate 5-dehydrogenase [Rhodoferax sp.]|nr:L-idonate 5-dehydrogenase [Rhodoferax sp.]
MDADTSGGRDLADALRRRPAVDYLNKGLVDVKPLISATLSYRDSARAFALAADRSQAMKVLLKLD